MHTVRANEPNLMQLSGQFAPYTRTIRTTNRINLFKFLCLNHLNGNFNLKMFTKLDGIKCKQ